MSTENEPLSKAMRKLDFIDSIPMEYTTVSCQNDNNSDHNKEVQDNAILIHANVPIT